MMMYVFYYLEQGDTIIASNGFTKRQSHSVVIDNTYVDTVGGSSGLNCFGTTSTLCIHKMMMTRRKGEKETIIRMKKGREDMLLYVQKRDH